MTTFLCCGEKPGWEVRRNAKERQQINDQTSTETTGVSERLRIATTNSTNHQHNSGRLRLSERPLAILGGQNKHHKHRFAAQQRFSSLPHLSTCSPQGNDTKAKRGGKNSPCSRINSGKALKQKVSCPSFLQTDTSPT